MRQELRSAFNTRQYMLSKDFEIYYYSDVHFHNVDPHRHTYYEFYIFLEGDAALEVDSAQIPLQKGSIALIPPGVTHRSVVLDPDKPYRRFVFWISREYCNRLLAESPDYVYLMQQATAKHRYIFRYTSNGFNLIQSKVLRLLEEIGGNRYGRQPAITLCVNDLILSMNRSVYEDEHPAEGSDDSDLFQNLSTYIEEHLEEDLTLESLAQQFYVSKYYIAHFFKKTLGISVHQYIMKKRLERCRAHIMAGGDISRSYMEYGFKDYSNFYRAFKKEYGMSPKEFREVYTTKVTNRSDNAPEGESAASPFRL
ncbi:AraC-type DNA-binding protein [Lachnospiraceae bacterium NK3A20]|nr:AraC-type DNA-binding protein [Lachnospiraceae bacterium NK3A20]